MDESQDGSDEGRPPAGSGWLPPVDASPGQYTELARHVRESEVAGTADLRSGLSELHRRLAARPSAELEGLLAAVQDKLAEHRLSTRRARARGRDLVEQKVLRELRQQSLTPTELAASLDLPKETVSRALTALTAAGSVGHVVDDQDRRRKRFSTTESAVDLTASGLTDALDQRAFGERSMPAGPAILRDDGSYREYLEQVLAAAIDERRRANRLADAIVKLDFVVTRAERLKDPALEISARAELLTTLRQDCRYDEQVAHFDAFVEVLNGRRPTFPAGLAAHVLGHLAYERGRLTEGPRCESLARRVQLLTTAQTAYGDLARETNAEYWWRREAWATVSLADKLREQTLLGQAIHAAMTARASFAEIGDHYGITRTYFLEGFCRRLRGQLPEAHDCLRTSLDLADEYGFNRFRVDSLMQLGEVERCLGDRDAAEKLLSGCLEGAKRMSMTKTAAFAYSALGALHFNAERLEDALVQFRRAHELFVACGHLEGTALNLRRQAAARRKLLQGGSRELFQAARDIYGKKFSPAGVAACEVGLGWLELSDKRRLGLRVEALMRLLTTQPTRQLIELDPWVPHLIATFAGEAGHGELQAEASAVVEAAEYRDPEGAREVWAVWEKAGKAKPGSRRPPTPAGRRPLEDEMAGEPRCFADQLV